LKTPAEESIRFKNGLQTLCVCGTEGILFSKVVIQKSIRRKPFMAKVELKKPIVEEISANLEGAAGVVLVDHCGLTVEQDTQLRKQMRAEGIVYKVYKNTMLNFAIKGTEFEPLSKHLEGPSAVAISKTDATAPARIIANFAKNADKLEIKAGIVEGSYYDAKGMTAIANVPSREVLLGRLLGSMQSPIANFARVINQIAEKEA